MIDRDILKKNQFPVVVQNLESGKTSLQKSAQKVTYWGWEIDLKMA